MFNDQSFNVMLSNDIVSFEQLGPEKILCGYSSYLELTLRKHAYSNILKILPPKNENYQMKNSDIFHISALNIDYGYSLEAPRRGGSNEYP